MPPEPGSIHQDLSNFDQALVSTLKSLSSNLITQLPMNLGILYLLTGDYRNGWSEYEYRHECKSKSTLYMKPRCKPWTKKIAIKSNNFLLYPNKELETQFNSADIKTLRAKKMKIKFCLDPKLQPD